MHSSRVVCLLLLTFLSFSYCLDLCNDDSGFNDSAPYNDTSVANCGCKDDSCIRKCCKAGFYLARKRTCRPSNTSTTAKVQFELPVYNKRNTLSKLLYNNASYKVGILQCQRYFRVTNQTFFVREDGLLWVPGDQATGSTGVLYENSDYCVDELKGLSVFVCFPEDNPAEVVGRDVNASGMIISMPFLLATFLVYAILPDRNLHQRALMFYVLALLLSYVLLVTINLAEHLEEPWCKTMGYSTLYFFMVSFFWMNVICFDIWYTFSGGRGFVGSKRSTERKRLILYGLYAFGVPLLVIMVVYLLQIFLPEASVHHPGIGIAKCFLAEGWPSLWYFYGEAGILVIINIIFFLLTALKIRKVKQETSMLKSSDSKRHTFEKDKQKAQLYMRLLLAMGVNWSMEVISWLVNWRTNSTVQYIWYLTDFFNAMYGVFIFFLFVFKKKIWKLLQRRYYNFRGKPHLAHTMTSTNTRTSHYSSTNYSTTETNLPERSSTTNGRAQPTTVTPEEVALRRVM